MTERDARAALAKGKMFITYYPMCTRRKVTEGEARAALAEAEAVGRAVGQAQQRLRELAARRRAAEARERAAAEETQRRERAQAQASPVIELNCLRHRAQQCPDQPSHVERGASGQAGLGGCVSAGAPRLLF